MTYNTNGIEGDYKDKKFVKDFLVVIDSIHPQVLALQEMFSHYSDTLCDELKLRYQYNSLSVFASRRNDNKNVACFFSTYPIKKFLSL